MTSTLLLDTVAWDLVLDASGNIAVASEPYSQAQDVASACRTFLGELWYDTTQGVPYFGNILGRLPSLGFVKTKLQAAALAVPGVVSATAYVTGLTRQGVLIGQIQIETSSGATATIQMGQAWYVTAVSLDAAAAPPVDNFSQDFSPDFA